MANLDRPANVILCDATYLIVYRPNQAAPVKLAYGTTACSQPARMLQISAISLGTGG